MESASEDQQYVLYAEVWWPESAPKQIYSDSDQRHLYQVINTLKRYHKLKQRTLWSVIISKEDFEALLSIQDRIKC